MKRFITYDDITIYDKDIYSDNRRAGYNIGDLLNMPSLHNIWNQCPHADKSMLYRMNNVGNCYENSILSLYCKNRNSCDEIIPNIQLIKDVVLQFTNENKHNYIDIFNLIQEQTTLCVHVRNGDLDTEESYIDSIIRLSSNYKYVVLLTGIHLDETYKSTELKKQNILNTINSILQKNNNIYVYIDKQDVHLTLMMFASNLLVHKGGFSCLGSIVSMNNLFITQLFTYVKCSNWINLVNRKYILI